MMIRIFVILVSLLALPFQVSFAGSADPRTMTFPSVDFHPPSAKRVVLDSGMVVYLLEDHELPLIRLNARIRTGSIYEPSDKIGLAGLTGSVMRTGGTRSITGDELDEELEFMAAHMGSSIGRQSGSASLNLLKKDLDRGLALFANMLMHPAFAEDKLELTRRQILESIRRRNDNPSRIASREFWNKVYGPDHPLARRSTKETIQRIKREDLVAFHSATYFPNAVILAVSGDFKTGRMIRKIRKAFAGWLPGKAELPPLPAIHDPFKASVNLIEKDISQTHIRIGHLGIRESHPDYFAVTLLDDILGNGGFRSRLFKEVRARLGLAYSVGSVFTPGHLERGVFLAYSETKAESTHQAITAIWKEIEKIRNHSITEDELRLAKDSFLNSFVFSYSSQSQIVNRQAALEYYGLPADHLDRFRDRIIGVTLKDLQTVSQKYLKPESLIVVAVGRSDQFDKPLSSFGKVNIIELEAIGESRP